MSVVRLAEHRSSGITAMPVSDRATVAYGLGRAIAGEQVIVELSSTSRLLAVLEPLAEAVRVAAAGEFAVPLGLLVPYGGEAGPAVDREVLGLLAALPGLRVLCAGGDREATALLSAATHPTVVLVSRVGADSHDGVSTTRTRRSGAHLTVLCWGPGVSAAVEAADQLAAEGIEAEIIELVTLSPLPIGDITASIQRTGRLVVAASEATFADQLRLSALGDAFLYLESPPVTAAASASAIAAAASRSVHF